MKFSEVINPAVLTDETQTRVLIVTFGDMLQGQPLDSFWYERWVDRNSRVYTWAYEDYYDNYEADEDGESLKPIDPEELKIKFETINHDELISALDDLIHCLGQAARQT